MEYFFLINGIAIFLILWFINSNISELITELKGVNPRLSRNNQLLDSIDLFQNKTERHVKELNARHKYETEFARKFR